MTFLASSFCAGVSIDSPTYQLIQGQNAVSSPSQWGYGYFTPTWGQTIPKNPQTNIMYTQTYQSLKAPYYMGSLYVDYFGDNYISFLGGNIYNFDLISVYNTVRNIELSTIYNGNLVEYTVAGNCGINTGWVGTGSTTSGGSIKGKHPSPPAGEVASLPFKDYPTGQRWNVRVNMNFYGYSCTGSVDKTTLVLTTTASNLPFAANQYITDPSNYGQQVGVIEKKLTATTWKLLAVPGVYQSVSQRTLNVW